MGSWGVRAHESDYGLDLLSAAVEKYLRGVKFKTFHVRHILEIMRSDIIDRFAKESYGWELEYTDFFYGYTFKYNFAHAVILVAECIAEYRQNGAYLICDFATEKTKKRQVKDFIFTEKDLYELQTELQSILVPKHPLHDSWADSDSFCEWQTHIQTLCDTLSQAITEGGDNDE